MFKIWSYWSQRWCKTDWVSVGTFTIASGASVAAVRVCLTFSRSWRYCLVLFCSASQYRRIRGWILRCRPKPAIPNLFSKGKICFQSADMSKFYVTVFQVYYFALQSVLFCSVLGRPEIWKKRLEWWDHHSHIFEHIFRTYFRFYFVLSLYYWHCYHQYNWYVRQNSCLKPPDFFPDLKKNSRWSPDFFGVVTDFQRKKWKHWPRFHSELRECLISWREIKMKHINFKLFCFNFTALGQNHLKMKVKDGLNRQAYIHYVSTVPWSLRKEK